MNRGLEATYKSLVIYIPCNTTHQEIFTEEANLMMAQRLQQHHHHISALHYIYRYYTSIRYSVYGIHTYVCIYTVLHLRLLWF